MYIIYKGVTKLMQIQNVIVLLVEDNETNIIAAKGLLKLLKVRVDTAQNGKDALRMIREKCYDLILMDHFMPGMDGLETTSSIRSMEGEYYKSVPIIALTANEEPGAREQCLLAGMDDFLAKPIGIEELREVINRYLPIETSCQPSPVSISDMQRSNAPLPDIEGINVLEGIRNSGTETHFIRLLNDFYQMIDLKSDRLEDHLAARELDSIAMEAHTLKSTARILGAGELSEDFRRLELFGLNGNSEALIRETPDVIQHLRRFKPLLKGFVEEKEYRHKTQVSGSELIRLLQTIINAIDGFDLDSADEALDKLDECVLPVALAEHMEMLKAYTADVAMEKIMETAGLMADFIKRMPSSHND